jgi:hypothetical protein
VRRYRIHFTVRAMMAAVGLVSLVLGLAITFMRRPYPVETRSSVGVGSGPTFIDTSTLGLEPPSIKCQLWSDGWLLPVDSRSGGVRGFERYGPVTRALWWDGSRSWYWLPYRRVDESRYMKYWDGHQTWHWENRGGLRPITVTGPFQDEVPPVR